MNKMDIDELMTMLKRAEPVVSTITNTEEPVMQTNRCAHSECKKKLLLSDPVCKCKYRFCSLHRQAELHSCSFDYKSAGQKQLETILPKVIGQNFDRI